MSNYNPNKKIKIEIKQCINPAYDYEVWDIRDKDRSKCISRNATEQNISDILTPSQYEQFKAGGHVILVRSLYIFSYLGYTPS
jgi:hypothetical protein